MDPLYRSRQHELKKSQFLLSSFNEAPIEFKISGKLNRPITNIIQKLNY